MISTPPPPERLHTPPTPLHGARYDEWQPYSPRRSARSHARRPTETLSSPKTSPRDNKKQQSIASASTPVSRRSNRQVSSQTLSPPSTPESARQRAAIDLSSRRQLFHNRALLQDPGAEDEDIESHLPITMIPTPRKTPLKNTQKSTSRNIQFRLQDTESLLPTPSKRRQRITLESPDASPAAPDVPIFNDSQDRVPDMDTSEKNPFVGPRQPAQPRSRRPRRKYAMTEEEREMDEAVKNDEGLIYTL